MGTTSVNFWQFFKTFTTQIQHLINFLFWATSGNQMDCAKKLKRSNFSFIKVCSLYIASSNKDSLPVLRSTIALVFKIEFKKYLCLTWYSNFERTPCNKHSLISKRCFETLHIMHFKAAIYPNCIKTWHTNTLQG